MITVALADNLTEVRWRSENHFRCVLLFRRYNTFTAVSVCLLYGCSAVLKNWSLVLFGTGRRRRSTDDGGGGSGADLRSWAAVRSATEYDDLSAAGALSTRSLGPLVVLPALLAVCLSCRDAGAPPSGRIT